MWLLILLACNGSNPTDSGPSDSAPDTADSGTGPVFGLDARPPNPTCVAPERPVDADATIALQRTFQAVSLPSMVHALMAPSIPDTWYGVVQSGQVHRWQDRDDTPAPTLVIDIAVEDGGEKGLLGWAIDPDFASNGYAYANLTRRQAGVLNTLITRYHSADGGLSFDVGSETVMLAIEQPRGNHNGGHLAFGPDGYLYVGMGDGGGADDEYDNGQNLDSELGAMLRLDVSGDTATAPADNPFVGTANNELIWAYGLRNPYRWSFDRVTGNLWAGDVGQGTWEEVSIVTAGANLGWPLKEGSACFAAAPPCDDPSWIDPVLEYPHTAGNRSITGGYVYRGSAQPQLTGTYFYGDFYTGTIWAGTWDDGAGAWTATEAATGTGILISSFAEGAQGEIYAVDYGGGGLHHIELATPTAVDFPQRLSDTGCVDASDPATPVAGMIPYGLAVPFWSDGADKERWLALPDGERISVEQDGDWTLPVGSVLLKHFRVAGDLVESRLFVRHSDGAWGGYSYAWLPDGSDAVLLAGHEERAVQGQTWIFPSRGECLQCHTEAAGGSLGLETAQLGVEHDYGQVTAHQLQTLVHIDLLDPAPPVDAAVLDPTDARAWLHSNCASCHRPSGPGGGALDLRHSTPLASMGACDVPPDNTDLGVPGAVLLAPGEPERSLISLRARLRDGDAMPPLGSTLVDAGGVAMLDAWIAGLGPCP